MTLGGSTDPLPQPPKSTRELQEEAYRLRATLGPIVVISLRATSWQNLLATVQNPNSFIAPIGNFWEAIGDLRQQLLEQQRKE